MKLLDVQIPEFPKEKFYADKDVAPIKKKLDEIKANYSTYVRRVAKAVNLPEEIIYSFIFIESAGNKMAKNGRAYGLMQIGSNSATEILSMEYLDKNLSQEEEQIIIDNAGLDALNRIKKMKRGEVTYVITPENLYNPELNILIGSIYLSILINKVTEAKGKLELAYVVAGYNMGYYGAKKLFKLSKDELLNSTNPITKSYITKLSGKNGILDILV